jgi:hypothetical protein
MGVLGDSVRPLDRRGRGFDGEAVGEEGKTNRGLDKAEENDDERLRWGEPGGEMTTEDRSRIANDGRSIPAAWTRILADIPFEFVGEVACACAMAEAGHV